jgi:hypothetical protein
MMTGKSYYIEPYLFLGPSGGSSISCLFFIPYRFYYVTFPVYSNRSTFYIACHSKSRAAMWQPAQHGWDVLLGVTGAAAG